MAGDMSVYFHRQISLLALAAARVTVTQKTLFWNRRPPWENRKSNRPFLHYLPGSYLVTRHLFLSVVFIISLQRFCLWGVESRSPTPTFHLLERASMYICLKMLVPFVNHLGSSGSTQQHGHLKEFILGAKMRTNALLSLQQKGLEQDTKQGS